MAEEAEKLINISLCKMAESRSVRRGGTSLHKHLLISTVLTKARSAYLFETWYMGDGEASVMDGGHPRTINLNVSYQEEDFPLDDDEDDDDLLDPDEPALSSSMESYGPETHLINARETEPNENQADLDPRFFVESEIELPSDILNCVEKLGDLSEHMSFTANESACSASTPDNNMNESCSPVEVSSVDDDPYLRNNSLATQRTYLDLDSRSTTDISDSENNNLSESLIKGEGATFGEPLGSSTPNPSKRRRGWSVEEDDSVEECEGEENEVNSSPQRFNSREGELSERMRRNGLSVTKRLRFSPECDEPVTSPPSNDNVDEKNFNLGRPLPIITDSKFRTKKSHFDEDDLDDSEEDPFLGDALGQNSYDGDVDEELLNKKSHQNDRRVPSASSSGSCSDEDGEAENSMEVDQITNLVQYISFNKHLPLVNVSSSTSLNGSTAKMSPQLQSSSASGLGTSSSLVRSMSSPDLCGLAASSSRALMSSNASKNAKDLFTSYMSNSNNSHISHRVLTMTV